MPWTCGHLRRVQSPAVWGLPLLALAGASLTGCGPGGPGAVHISAQERIALEQRSTNLLLRAAESDDPVLACNALEALVKAAPDDGLARFRAALVSNSILVRCAGLKALGTLRDKQALPAYRQAMADQHPLVRLAGAFAACRAGDTQAAGMLVAALDDHPEERVRAEAAQLIGLLEEPRAARHLQAALRIRANERSNMVRVEIYAALARLGKEDAARHLIEFAQYDALSRLLALQSLAELRIEQAHDALLYHLNDQDDYLVHRLLAARGLARLGDRSGYKLAVDSLRYVGTNPEDPAEAVRVRTNAAFVLAELGDGRALGPLKTLAEGDHDSRVQVAACYAICRILNR